VHAKNKTAEGDTHANRAGDGFSWAPYLHVMLATCPTNQFSLYTQIILRLYIIEDQLDGGGLKLLASYLAGRYLCTLLSCCIQCPCLHILLAIHVHSVRSEAVACMRHAQCNMCMHCSITAVISSAQISTSHYIIIVHICFTLHVFFLITISYFIITHLSRQQLSSCLQHICIHMPVHLHIHTYL
jgi:hypothetical protein